jgi:predicted nucleic acid-binding protein
VLYLLDTTSLSALASQDNTFRSRLDGLPPDDHVVTCAIAWGETLFGLARLPAGRSRDKIEAGVAFVSARVICREVPVDAADFYADLKYSQQRLGLSLGENDLWIAATAKALGATLVTHDGDFGACQVWL